MRRSRQSRPAADALRLNLARFVRAKTMDERAANASGAKFSDGLGAGVARSFRRTAQ